MSIEVNIALLRSITFRSVMDNYNLNRLFNGMTIENYLCSYKKQTTT